MKYNSALGHIKKNKRRYCLVVQHKNIILCPKSNYCHIYHHIHWLVAFKKHSNNNSCLNFRKIKYSINLCSQLMEKKKY